jgi:sugar-specific transcriptional regulator TrmB
MLQEILIQNGMSKKEASIYLALLGLWTSTLTNVSKKLKENRATIYSIIETMKQKSWVSSVKKWNMLRYSPIWIEQFIATKQQNVQELIQHRDDFNLLNTFNTQPSKIQHYHGIDGMKKIYNDILSLKPKEIYIFRWIQYFDKKFQQYIDTIFIPQRVKNKTKVKVITWAQNEFKKYEQSDKKLLRETKIINKKLKPFSIKWDIILYDNTLAIVIQEENYSMSIQSELFYKNLVSIFDTLWSIAK